MNTPPLYAKTMHGFSILMTTIGLIIGLFLGTAGLTPGFTDPITPGLCTANSGQIQAQVRYSARFFVCVGGLYNGSQVQYPNGPTSGE